VEGFSLTTEQNISVSSVAVRGLGAVLVIAIVCSCIGLPKGDESTSVDLWNRTTAPFVVRIGADQFGECRYLAAQALGSAYSELAESSPQIRVYAMDGKFWMELHPETRHALFVVDEGSQVREYAVTYKESPSGDVGLIYDLPDVPELNGHRLPEELPRTSQVCG
jgi:hypothetical protein